MAQLRRDYQKFKDRNAEIIAVGPENQQSFAAFWIKNNMPFPGIPDHNHNLAHVYEQKVDVFKLGRMPALFIIDDAGKIRYRHYGNSMSDIPDNQDLLFILDELNRVKTKERFGFGEEDKNV